jgi:hydrogenase expression/formation protein HypC
MCLSVPGKVTALYEDTADVEISGVVYRAGTHLVDQIEVGDYVLVHSGYILEKLHPEEAEKTLHLFEEIEETDRGR